MGRIPLSDESLDLDDDVIDEEGTPGPEEQYADLNFNDRHGEREYEPEFDDSEDEYPVDDPWLNEEPV